jgi:predicted DNA-binding transcriptional regulator AlpA
MTEPLSRPINPDLIPAEPTAVILDVGLSHLRALIRKGEVPPPYKYGKKSALWSRREIEAIAEQRKAERAAAEAKRSRAKVSA